eukprot:COSAG02_NODE_7574_length_2955_cov_12.315476_2_plen_103_part_00
MHEFSRNCPGGMSAQVIPEVQECRHTAEYISSQFNTTNRLGPDAPDFTCTSTVPVVYMYTGLWYTYGTAHVHCTVLENGIPLLAGFQIGGIAWSPGRVASIH